MTNTETKRNNTFDIRRCRRTDYAAFLDTLNEAFGHSAESEWFQRNMANCTPCPALATDSEIANHVIAVESESGRIVGGVGAYLFDIVVSVDAPDGGRFTLPAVGIGQVCCARDWRGRGVMTAALNRALDDAARSGAVLGILSGDRYRYGRFGFDFGGGNHKIDFRYARLKTAADAARLKTRVAGAADIAELDALYTTQASYRARGIEYWRMLLDRKRCIWRIGELDGKTAYIAYMEPYRTIAEICGDPDAAKAMLLSHMERHNLDRVTVCRPFAPNRADTLTCALLDVASHASAWPGGMGLTAILSAERTDDILRRAIDTYDAATEVETALVLGTLTNAELVRYLLGAPGHPVPHALRAGVAPRPLSLWVSDADSV